jgi:hypothetical protein
MDSNPYAPPKTPVADVSAPAFTRRRVVVMILLMIATFGFYYPIWFLVRRAALNSLDSPRKLQRWPFVTNVIVFSIVFLVDLIAGGSAGRVQVIGGGLSLALSLVQLAVAILMIVQCFAIKDILEDHLATPDSEVPQPFASRVELSGLMTFFFQIFYLQWAINRYIVDAPPAVA